MTEALSAAATLHEWAATRVDAQTMAGRGLVYSFGAPVSGPDARSRWVVRHYRRGGAAASYLGDRYLAVGVTRPEREFGASRVARARGVRTPGVIAGAWYRAGAFYRADVVTELVPDATSLADWLGSRAADTDGPGAAVVDALTRAGSLVATLAARGVMHADLNAMNVLLAGGEAWAIDLDRATVTAGEPVSSVAMARRLERSLRKVTEAAGAPLTEPEWAALRSGYGRST